jgi:outer membrane protein OmpA-like peptidoglycan-associated protein
MEGALDQQQEVQKMKKTLVALAISSLLVQSPLMAGERDQVAEKTILTGSMVGMLVGTLLGGAPGVVIGLTGGAMIGDLEASKQQVDDLADELEVAQGMQRRDQLAAAEHQALFQHQRELQYARIEALQEGYTFCLGFRSDSAEIEVGMSDQLKAMVVMLQAFPELKLHIQAGADVRGSDHYNKSLSKRRADAVADLLRESGLAEDRMELDYIGKAQARYPVQDREGLAYDRMVRLSLVKGDAS